MQPLSPSGVAGVAPAGLPQPAPPTKYLSTHALKERGWTATMIAALLPRHDASRSAYVQLPGNAHVKLYLRSRVEEAELSDDFLLAQQRATQAKNRRGTAARSAEQQEQLRRCVQRFRPAYAWPERWCQRSDWELGLADVQQYFDRWARKHTDWSRAARQRVLSALHDKNHKLFCKRFPGVPAGPQRPKKLAA